MHTSLASRRVVRLAATLSAIGLWTGYPLSAGAAPPTVAPVERHHPAPASAISRAAKVRIPITGAFGAYLEGRFAVSQSDMEHGAEGLLRALAADPLNQEIRQQAFTAAAVSGRPEAARLARQLPENPIARFLLADLDARAGNWDAAEQRFRALPQQALTQMLQSLLIAWAQQGGGHTDAALATLRPFVDGNRFRGVYALHAALIADLGGRNGDAARYYRTAQTEYGGMNLRLAQLLASWQARQGHPSESEATLQALTDVADDLSIALPAMKSAASSRAVTRATDGLAEAYLALAAALRSQDQPISSLLLLRLCLDLRPDFTPARLLLADIHDASGNRAAALAALAPVTPEDSLIATVRLRRASLTERLGHSDDAIHALEQIAHDYPASPLPLALLGDLLRTKNRFADAAAVYDKAIARIPTPGRNAWPLFYSRGIAFERSHDWPKAEADFQRALEIAPDQPYVLNYLGYSWADQGMHLIQARQMLQRALELRPNDGAIIDSMGWVELRQGNTKAAINALEHAVEIQPEDASINGHLGDAYWAAGRKREAQFQWRRALTLKPDKEDVPKLEAKLRDAAGTAENATDTSATAEHHVQ